ncbi:MAG: aminobenzoate oxygenase, partial [Actinomycetota bacterium]|nr:aminobenzoate oxygenase [Actinomycetota bacterium]
MSTHELYVTPVEMQTWDVEAQGAARFTWEYDDSRDTLLRLYQKGKDKQ